MRRVHYERASSGLRHLYLRLLSDDWRASTRQSHVAPKRIGGGQVDGYADQAAVRYRGGRASPSVGITPKPDEMVMAAMHRKPPVIRGADAQEESPVNCSTPPEGALKATGVVDCFGTKAESDGVTAPTAQRLESRLAFSVQEAAELLGVSTKSIRRLIARGLLRPCRALRHLLISRREIERFLHETSM
jgi:excisionase family DNA binding protein